MDATWDDLITPMQLLKSSFAKMIYFSLAMKKRLFIHIWFLITAIVSLQAQEPGIPSALYTTSGSVLSMTDSMPPLQITAGFYHTIPLAQFNNQGDWTQQGDASDLYRTAIFFALRRSLDKHFTVGICVPWYRTSLTYHGTKHPPGNYGISQVSDIRLLLAYHFKTGRFLVSSEIGTNVPVGNGLGEALHPAFPPGENGYWTLWGKTTAWLKINGEMALYGMFSYDFITPRSGALVEGSGALLLSDSTTDVIQGTIHPGDRITLNAGIVRRFSNNEIFLGYGFLYKSSAFVNNLIPDDERTINLVNYSISHRSLLHTVHSGCFHNWKQMKGGFMIQMGVGGNGSWSEFLLSGIISYNLK
ncbi:MAG TPA: hypothetical protein DEO70_12475 [Bacteroidales bacterium]|nr:MAG: hypothetical protein A2X11_13195 [Bacteroidetes bacterium GWE2_42_24]HBZ67644.1 hypothetical protein [Bacteroidales bacterium]